MGAGFIAGTLVTATGIGGGAFLTPVLIVGFGLPPATAVGTDLLHVTLTKVGALCSHLRDDQVDWMAAGKMLIGGLPAVAAVTTLTAWAGTRPGLSRLVTDTIGVALLLGAVSLLPSRRGAVPPTLPGRRQSAWLVGGGAIVGLLIALSSVGAGAISSPLLNRAVPGQPFRRLVGTELAQAVPIAGFAAAGHFLLGQVDLKDVAELTVGSIPGVLAGRLLGQHLPERWLRAGLAVMLLGAAGRLMT